MAVIDTQAHWYPRALLDAYIESEGYPGCRREGDSYAIEMVPGQWIPLPLRFVELELQLDTMRQAGVDLFVSSSASFGDVDALPVGQAKELAIAVNEERAAAEARFEGFLGLATVPWQDAAAAVAVIEDAVSRLGLRGALIHSNVVGRPIDSNYLRPVYERMSELRVPLFLHPGKTLLEPHVRDLGLEVILAYMFDTSLAALRLVLSGILEGLSLDVVHPHCGATLPYLAARIDGAYWKPYALGRKLEPPPSQRLRDFYTDTMCQSAETLAFARSFYGIEHMLYGSDYPYYRPAESLEFVRGCLTGPGAEAVLGGNASRLLRLDPPA
jgi:aminocarboxymuconate-semialdehyde decarboxylase